MQLHQSSWQEIDAYLTKSKGIIVPIGSTEQHGPNGLLGTDAICPEVIAKRAGDAGVPETTLTQISGERRVAEVARMLSGDTGEASRDLAREMLAARAETAR